MKDDNDNLNQFDQDPDINTPNIPGETEPDTTNMGDDQSDPYDTADSSDSDDQTDNTYTPSFDDHRTDDSETTGFNESKTDPVEPSDNFDSNDSSQPATNDSDMAESNRLPDFMAPAPAPKKPKRGKLVLIIIILVLLLALGGFVYWYYYLKPANTPAPDTTPAPQAKVETSLSYTDVIKDLKSDTPEKVAESFPNAKAFTADDVSAPSYKTKDSGFYISAKGDTQTVFVQSDSNEKYDYKTDGVSVDDKYIEINKPITDAFVAYFNEKGFKQVQTADQDLPQQPSVYVNDITVCSVSSSEDPASVSCTALENYTKDAETLKPVFATLKKAQTDIGETTILGIESTKTNQKLGYENIVVGIGDVRAVTGGYAGLLYKKTSDKTWSFLDGTQGPLPCEKYDTYAKQAAFEGDPCGEGKTVTVTAAEPKKAKAL